MRFKTFFDDYNAGKAGLKEIKAFQKWAQSKCSKRPVLRMGSFNSYTNKIIKQLEEGKKWVHFGLDWEDAYVIKHHNGILSKDA